MQPARSRLAPALAAHVLVLAVGIVPLWSAHLFGWIAADEGYLASTAARVADGEVPHRDFVDRFPGALVMWNAASRELFGESFAGPRRGLLLASVVLLVVIHALARRCLPPVAAGLVALAASGFGVPKWFASNPTWYVVLFGLAGAGLLWKGLERDRDGWFVAAGVSAALAISFKQTAGAFVTAALCGALALDSVERFRRGSRAAGGLERIVTCLLALMLPLILQFVLLRQGGVYYPVLLVLAPAVLTAAICAAALRGRVAPGSMRRGLLLGFGLAIGALPLFIYYAVHGALGDAVRGVLLVQWGAAMRHFVPYLGLGLLPPLLKVLLWVAAGALAGAAPKRIARLAPVIPLAVSLAAAWSATRGQPAGMLELLARELVMFLPLGVAATGAAAIVRGRSLGRAGVLALLTAGIAAVVYPLGAFLYGWYTAPIAIVAAAVLARRAYGPHVVAVAAGVAFVLAVAFPPGADQVDAGPGADRSHVVLDGAGGGLRVPVDEGRALHTIAEKIRSASAVDEPVFTYPADFGIYALAERRNPTRHLWVDFYADEEDFAEILGVLDRENVRFVVVRTVVPIDNPYRERFLAGIDARYKAVEHHAPYLLAVRRERGGAE
jgi:hypothetical protein